jgi:hypothetical protein
MADLENPRVLLGFDAREVSSPPRDWDAARREEYLLRPEVERPLSVDTLVWPSVFGEIVDLGWTGPVQGLWEDLGRMDQRLQTLPETAGWRIAVAWVPENDPRRSSEPANVPKSTTPNELGDEWSILGFDVADRWLLSGLANCWYEPSERTAFRRDWAGELNEHHLFHSAATARAFRDATDARVQEHAPFFVYCLLKIPDAQE